MQTETGRRTSIGIDRDWLNEKGLMLITETDAETYVARLQRDGSNGSPPSAERQQRMADACGCKLRLRDTIAADYWPGLYQCQVELTISQTRSISSNERY